MKPGTENIRESEELRDARAALAESEERIRGILETAANAIVTINTQGIIEMANPATERLFGYTRDELLGKNIKILMPSPYHEKHDGYLSNYLRTGIKKIIGIGREAVAQKKDGTVFPIDLSIGEVVLPDGRRVFTGIMRDLTERKKLEGTILRISEEEQRRIGQDIHDDLCQQLAAISCLAQVCYQQLKRSGTPEAENVAEIVRLTTTANTRAREMSRGLMPVVLDSAGLMDALEDLAASTARVFCISCPFLCEQPVEVTDNDVAVQLYRIAQEAVANAIKHSKASRIEISLQSHDDRIILAIFDDGVGIPDHSPGKGTGLGMLTMRHRARMMGGTLNVQQADSGGTRIECEVPIQKTSAPPQQSR